MSRIEIGAISGLAEITPPHTHTIESPDAPLSRAAKRALDLLGATVGSVLFLLPSIVVVAIIHRRHSPGPLFFRQARSGRNGEVFQVLKFRSMGADPDGGSDRVVFSGGDFLRKYSIDEIPQLINILKGDMSIVGPRPHPIEMDAELIHEIPEYRLRNMVTPGLTGLAQARGWRGPVRNARDIRTRVRLDLFYITHWSLGLDLRVILQTALQLVRPPSSAC